MAACHNASLASRLMIVPLFGKLIGVMANRATKTDVRVVESRTIPVEHDDNCDMKSCSQHYGKIQCLFFKVLVGLKSKEAETLNTFGYIYTARRCLPPGAIPHSQVKACKASHVQRTAPGDISGPRMVILMSK